jgi:hypothetical protein
MMKKKSSKKVFFGIAIFVLFGIESFSQTTIVLQPNSAKGKDAVISKNKPDTNYGDYYDLDALAWTNGGTPVTLRGLIDFDLSTIPENVIITSAYLSLYNNPQSSNVSGEHSSLSGSNACWLQRVIENWNENTVTWNNQPSVTTTNQVALSQSTSIHQDYENIDVTKLVKDMVSDLTKSFGFMLRLQTEEYYRCLILASSDAVDSTLHPKLEICYKLSTNIMETSVNNNVFKVFPNPTHDYINIKLMNNKEATFDILNMNGQLISKICIHNGYGQIDISEYNKGIYFIRLNVNGYIQSKRIVKE